MRLPYVSRVAFEAALSRAATEQDSARSLSKQLLSEMNRRDTECIRANEAEMEVTHLNDTIRNLHNENEALRESNRGVDAQLAEQIARAVSADERAEAFRQSAAHADAARIATETHLVLATEQLRQEYKRYDDLLARYHEASSRTIDLVEMALKPAPVTVQAPTQALQDFPPEVGAALAMATAGFRPDVIRDMRRWAQGELDRGAQPKVVAERLLVGEPVSIDMEEAH